MELNTLLLFLAILICPLSMSVMMWKMNKNVDNRHVLMMSKNLVHGGRVKKSEKCYA